jgi:septum formation protein
MTKLILASTSPYRKALLQQAGLNFQSVSPLCDEENLKDPQLNAMALTAKLAQHKAESLKIKFPQDIIIGSDQVLEFNGKIYGKAHTREKAILQLQELNGHEHCLVTSIYLCGPDTKTFFHTDVTRLKMRQLTDSEIRDYVDTDLPLDCAGSYKIEKRGITLFDSINSQDYHSIQGLPLLACLRALKNWGYPLLTSTPVDVKKQMFDMAKLAQKNSYAPYSTKHIASSILWSDGRISYGSNIENASYGATVCAERTAIWNGLTQDSTFITDSNNKQEQTTKRYQRNRIKAVLVLSEASPPWPPCGMCRQVISEFAEDNLKVYLVNLQNEWLEYSWKEIFPLSFTPTHLFN